MPHQQQAAATGSPSTASPPGLDCPLCGSYDSRSTQSESFQFPRNLLCKKCGTHWKPKTPVAWPLILILVGGIICLFGIAMFPYALAHPYETDAAGRVRADTIGTLRVGAFWFFGLGGLVVTAGLATLRGGQGAGRIIQLGSLASVPANARAEHSGGPIRWFHVALPLVLPYVALPYGLINILFIPRRSRSGWTMVIICGAWLALFFMAVAIAAPPKDQAGFRPSYHRPRQSKPGPQPRTTPGEHGRIPEVAQ